MSNELVAKISRLVELEVAKRQFTSCQRSLAESGFKIIVTVDGFDVATISEVKPISKKNNFKYNKKGIMKPCKECLKTLVHKCSPTGVCKDCTQARKGKKSRKSVVIQKPHSNGNGIHINPLRVQNRLQRVLAGKN